MIQKPKGTYDLFGLDAKRWQYLENLLKNLCEKYNYTYIKTPTFEVSELFHRSVGETTDIVRKETYDFIDRGNRNMTLRPEGTAGVVRSYIENKMYAKPNQPTKVYYFTSCFRYERPQAGRYREHTQFGIENLGVLDPMIDAEIISIPVTLFKLLGFKSIVVKLNSLGDESSRENYKTNLIDYFKPHLNDLCQDCKERLEKNPLRVLDCKIDANKSFFKDAPKIIDYLNEDSKSYFEKVKEYLKSMDITYKIDSNLVRGLDYYNHTIFEVQADIEGFGSQNTLCGGGRYNNLVESLDGPSTPGMGFGMGLERVLLALEKENIDLIGNTNFIDVFLYGFENTNIDMFKLAYSLRINGFKVDLDYQHKNLGNAFKQADRLNSKYIIIVGEEELKNNQVIVKNNSTKEQELVNIDNLIEYLDNRVGE